ncbi:MAG TPA: PxKF domain-containing protein [Pyrinomonadaceae bacterium]|nr:PxKF domain-containing protein [Pyrinomonadaceae bacterium]
MPLPVGGLNWANTTGAAKGVQGTVESAHLNVGQPHSGVPSWLMMPQGPGPEAITMYESDCTTPASSFELGDEVCAKITGSPIETGVRQIAIVNSANYVVANASVSADGQTLEFTIPTTATTALSPELTVDNRGQWLGVSVGAGDGYMRAATAFIVTDPAQAVADVSIGDASQAEVASQLRFTVFVSNNGPQSAAAVQVTDEVPVNATFDSVSHDASVTCAETGGIVTCDLGSLASGATEELTFVYTTAAAVGTEITHTPAVASSTFDSQPLNNESTATIAVSSTAGAPAVCVLDCPGDITVVANASQGGNPGAFVSFASAEPVGTCGEVIASTPSGSFFQAGTTTTVTVTSETGGGSCSFDVTVVTEGAPMISCPANVTVAAGAGATEATVNPGSPTTTPSTGVSVSGVRSDNELLTAPYPVGLTHITWTVTDSVGLTASCTQVINVSSEDCAGDTTPPTITAPPDVTLSTPAGTVGSCGRSIGESTLGTADASDNCVFNVSRTGVPAGNFFPVGSTTITYTVTDAAGNSASDQQVVTITDESAPVIAAPADASYVCPSEVPAANPSQATRGEVLDENGNPLPPGPPIDNCGAPVVTVTETTSGAGSAADPLIITRTFTATDAALNSSSAVQTITVADGVAPTITAPADLAFQCASEIPAGNPADATAADNCSVTVAVSDSSNNGAGSSASPLVITRTFTATDSGGNTASDSQTITVIDNTAPVVSAPADASYQCETDVPAANANDATASDNCGTATLAVTQTTNGGAGSIASPLIITRTYTATDAVGNSASDAQTITVIDNTAPVISCPANITVFLPLNSPAVSMPVTYPAPTATDNCATPTVATNIASGSTFPVGTTTITATATDAKNNSSSCTFTITVLYNFTGFFSPVDNLPTLNSMKAGQAVPLKFSLSGDKGLNIFPANSPNSVQIACDTGAPVAEVEETSAAGSSTLTYDAASDRYHYVWKTESSWKNTCRQLNVVLNDGSTHSARFKFK